MLFSPNRPSIQISVYQPVPGCMKNGLGIKVLPSIGALAHLQL